MWATGTFDYNSAKFLVHILNLLTHNDFTEKNSFEFTRELNSTKFSETYFLVRFDVKSLFTNIPLESLHETIDLCVNECEKLKLVPYNLTKKQLKLLLKISMKESIFLFDHQLYQ